MHKVGGAVNGVNDPGWMISERAIFASLLSQEKVFWKAISQS